MRMKTESDIKRGQQAGPTEAPGAGARTPRWVWLDIMRGIASLWIVYYHTYSTYASHKPRLNPSTWPELVGHYLEQGWSPLAALFGAGHDIFAIASMGAVGIFVIMSGYGLTRSAFSRERKGQLRWGAWLGDRFWRLYPFFWVAHLIFAFGPFVWQPEALDYRFWISLTGVRAYPMHSIFFYANPSWWFFWLIIQLYLIFPLCYVGIKRCGPVVFFLASLVLCLIGRYWILFIAKDGHGMITGGFFISRFAEFAFGMALALWDVRNPGQLGKMLIGLRPFFAGIFIYVCGILCYGQGLYAYILVDPVASIGCFLLVANLASWLKDIPGLNRFLVFAGTVSLGTFLLHQPWSITLGRALRDWSFADHLAPAILFMSLMPWTSSLVQRGVDAVVEPLRRRLQGQKHEVHS